MKQSDLRGAIKEGFLFYTFSVLLIAVQFILYLFQSSFAGQMDFGGMMFFIAASLSQAALFALFPLLLYMGVLYLTRSKRAANMVHVTLQVLLNLFLFVNGFVFALYRFHINGFVLDMLLGEGSDEIFVFDTMLYIKVAACLLVIVGLNILFRYLSKKIYVRSGRCFFVPIAVVLLASVLLSNLYHAYSNVEQKASVIRSAAHLPYYFPFTANRFMVKLGVISPDNLTRVNVDNRKGNDISYPLNPLQSNSLASPQKNIILILFDSWNYRTFNSEVMPNLFEFTPKSSVYTNHQSSGNGTQGGVFGLFYSLPATYWKDFGVMDIHPLLMTELHEKGYNINAYSSASLVNPPFIKMLFSNDKNIRTKTEGKTVYERDCRITKDYIEFLDTVSPRHEPFFSLLFYDLAHGISVPKEKLVRFTPSWEYADYTKLDNDTDPTPFFNLYRNCVAVIDSLIGEVIQKLEEKNMLENSVIIITGDHGQEFNENKHNYWGHKSNNSQTQIHVPFVFYDADIEPATYTHRTTHYDVAPTLMQNYLGVTNPTDDYGRGTLLGDTTFRDWHYVGDNLDYAFLLRDNVIIKLYPTGRYEITDSMLNELKGYRISPKSMSDALQQVNRYYK